MTKLGLAEAAKLTGKSQSTIHRAMANHKLAFEKSDNGERVIDPAELNRVFPYKIDAANVRNVTNESQRHATQSDVTAAQLEAANVRLANLEQKFIDGLHQEIANLKADKERLERQNEKLLGLVESQSKQVLLLTDQRKPPQTAQKHRWWPFGRSTEQSHQSNPRPLHG